MKSVFPSVTDMIRRPRIASRNPRATVSTSGSSGIRREHDQNITPQQPILFAQQNDLTWFSDLFAGLSRKNQKTKRQKITDARSKKKCLQGIKPFTAGARTPAPVRPSRLPACSAQQSRTHLFPVISACRPGFRV